MFDPRRGTVVPPTGPAVLVQIKSNTEDVVVEGDRLQTLCELDLPYYIGVVDKAGLRLKVFQTRERISHRYHSYTKLTIKLEDSPPDFRNEPPNGLLFLGKPIVDLGLDELETAHRRAELFDIMHTWALIDLQVIGWNLNGFPVSLTVAYETNAVPSLHAQRRVQYNEGVVERATYGLREICNAHLGLLQLASRQGEIGHEAVIESLRTVLQAIDENNGTVE